MAQLPADPLSYGSTQRPVRLDPWHTIVGVHWGGGRVVVVQYPSACHLELFDPNPLPSGVTEGTHGYNPGDEFDKTDFRPSDPSFWRFQPLDLITDDFLGGGDLDVTIDSGDPAAGWAHAPLIIYQTTGFFISHEGAPPPSAVLALHVAAGEPADWFVVTHTEAGEDDIFHNGAVIGQALGEDLGPTSIENDLLFLLIFGGHADAIETLINFGPANTVAVIQDAQVFPNGAMITLAAYPQNTRFRVTAGGNLLAIDENGDAVPFDWFRVVPPILGAIPMPLLLARFNGAGLI